MLPEVRRLVDEVERARNEFVAEVERLPPDAGEAREAAGDWSVAEVVEHLVWAEHGGLAMMVEAVEAWRRGDPLWSGAHPFRDEGIDAIVARTWREKEEAPASAQPTTGGPLSYWLAFLRSCRVVLAEVADDIRADELDEVVNPHFLSGPLTLRQRLEFLRFHLDRHRAQVATIRGRLEPALARTPEAP